MALAPQHEDLALRPLHAKGRRSSPRAARPHPRAEFVQPGFNSKHIHIIMQIFGDHQLLHLPTKS